MPPQPVQDDSATHETPDQAAGVDLAWLWPILRTSAVALLIAAIAAGPFLIVIGAKAARRRGRRKDGIPSARIAGGWDEYVDAALDAGRDVPVSLTREELAATLATASGGELAVTADRAVFSGSNATDEDAQGFWKLVDSERRQFREKAGCGAGSSRPYR